MPVTIDDVAWCYRTLLGREPESVAAAETHASEVNDLRSLFLRFITSHEYVSKKKVPPALVEGKEILSPSQASSSSRITVLPRNGIVDMVREPVTREAVEWAYRLILGRPPESDAAVSYHLVGCPSIEALRARFQRSREASVERPSTVGESVPVNIISQFKSWSGKAENDSFRDFLGVRTRLSFVPAAYSRLAGTTQGLPGMETMTFHDVGEWTGLLSGVLDAKGRFVGMELGAGWGPWIVSGAAAARQQGIQDIRLIGVEGSSSHVNFMSQHLRDNALDPEDHLILHAVVGTYDGVARFPKLERPELQWGAEAIFAGSDSPASSTVQRFTEYEEVRCVSVSTLLAGLPPIDVVHIDIQGAEAEVVHASIEALSSQVRRLVVGTHSRAIEAKLMALLPLAGWILELEKPCVVAQSKNIISLRRDGVQVWRNGSPL